MSRGLINLDRLHKVHHIYNASGSGIVVGKAAQVGRTLYVCSLVAGALQVLENEPIYLIVDTPKNVWDFTIYLSTALHEQGLEFSGGTVDGRELNFNGSSCTLRMLTVEDVVKRERLRGRRGACIFADLSYVGPELAYWLERNNLMNE